MMKTSYGEFAYIYDQLMQDMDYDLWINYIKRIFERFNVKPNIILELACGTGNFCIRLARQGYDMIGLDISQDMLNVAVPKAKDSNVDVLLLQQDMKNFELYGTVDVILCLLDSINYITSESDLLQVFKLVKNYLNPGGLFIFDINSAYKLKKVLGNNIFTVDEDENENGIFYVWENNYDQKSKICEFYLTFFICDGEKYDRVDEIHREKAYSISSIRKYVRQAGLELLGIYNELTFEAPQSDSERIFFIVRRKD